MSVRVDCACGRVIDSRVFRQHGRKCTAQLVKWSGSGNHVQFLDERTRRPTGCTCGTHDFHRGYICDVCRQTVLKA